MFYWQSYFFINHSTVKLTMENLNNLRSSIINKYEQLKVLGHAKRKPDTYFADIDDYKIINEVDLGEFSVPNINSNCS